jgi:hypothetical protein
MQSKLPLEVVIKYNLRIEGLSYNAFFILQREHHDTIVLQYYCLGMSTMALLNGMISLSIGVNAS